MSLCLMLFVCVFDKSVTTVAILLMRSGGVYKAKDIQERRNCVLCIRCTMVFKVGAGERNTSGKKRGGATKGKGKEKGVKKQVTIVRHFFFAGLLTCWLAFLTFLTLLILLSFLSIFPSFFSFLFFAQLLPSFHLTHLSPLHTLTFTMPVLNVRDRVKNSSVWHEFKEFIQRGNIIDLGVVRYYTMATANSSFTTAISIAHEKSQCSSEGPEHSCFVVFGLSE